MRLFHHSSAQQQSSSASARYEPPPGPPPGRTRRTAPPAWTAAPEVSHTDGLYNEATTEDYEGGEAFCARFPLEPPRFIASAAVESIAEHGCGAWGLVSPQTSHFVGSIARNDAHGLAGAWRIVTGRQCRDTCVLSDLPIIGGMYEVPAGKRGVYYEVTVHAMNGVIAVGTACRPYPAFRLPGWNRQSAALHLDDMRKFFEDPDGGRDYAPGHSVYSGCVVGCGFEFASGALFFTLNGTRLPDAFRGLYLPRAARDVYAAIGVDGANELEVNFGAASFVWKEGNESTWSIEEHVGRVVIGSSSSITEVLPSYSRIG